MAGEADDIAHMPASPEVIAALLAAGLDPLHDALRCLHVSVIELIAATDKPGCREGCGLIKEAPLGAALCMDTEGKHLVREPWSVSIVPVAGSPGAVAGTCVAPPHDMLAAACASPRPGVCTADVGAETSCSDIEKQTNNPTALKRIWPHIVSELITHLVSSLGSVQEPKRSGFLHRVVSSTMLECVSLIVILVNAIFVSLAVEWEMKHVGQETVPFMLAVEASLVALFLLELVLRLANHGFYYFVNQDMLWNLLDLVLISLASVATLATVFHDMGNVTSFGGTRVLRAAGLLRMFRFVKVFRGLAQTLLSFRKCLVVMWWSLVTVAFAMYFFAVVFMEGLTFYAASQEDVLDEETLSRIEFYFGSMADSMLSLYMSVTGGVDWQNIFHVVNQAGPFFGCLLVLFNGLFVVALFNVVTSLFVAKAVDIQRPMLPDIAAERDRRAAHFVEELKRVCRLLDAGNTGSISKPGFVESMKDGLVASHFTGIGLDINDASTFFDLVVPSSDPEAVSVEAFVHGCLSLTGFASKADVKRQMIELRVVKECVEKFAIDWKHTCAEFSALAKLAPTSQNSKDGKERAAQAEPVATKMPRVKLSM
eukprot:TRINITY_DN67945_c0_g1_i1.p1 TRINITY_DN67945_c0_g1~~TRINITY_DN67945_c0_g1_i1.p1  ORF type:complete len:613 (-),score=126.66 TRINITY_DN67945_c0_g1_i1:66-1853(-)